jgi:hypothetical protein
MFYATEELEIILRVNAPYSDTGDALKLIIDSVTSRYVGELENGDDAHNGGVIYWPTDKEEIREIMTELWGALIPASIRDDIIKYLMRGTTDPNDWPLAVGVNLD